ncbi:MAG: beta-propeller domain-containing protein [Candidatus Methanospirareceae archaeon]
MKKLVTYIILACVAMMLVGICVFVYEYKMASNVVEAEMEKFSSEEDFLAYLLKSSELERYGSMYMLPMRAEVAPMIAPPTPLPMPTPMPTPIPPPPKTGENIPLRVSKTTVQVEGIDEPDIVKTDGKYIYFSSGYRGWGGETRVIEAFPPINLSIKSKIEEGGDLLLKDNMLIILSSKKIYGYDVSNPEEPEEEWEIELNGTLVTARLYGKDVYLVSKNWVNRYNPVPIVPFSTREEAIVIKSTQIYHPVHLVPVDVIYTVAELDPEGGKIKRTISFVGSSWNSVIYMSKEALYVTYTYNPSPVRLYYELLKEECNDLIPKEVLKKIDRLMGYDISDRAKLVEIGVILEEYKSSLNGDERKEFENELHKRIEDYMDEHKRELEMTVIVKIGLSDFEISAEGKVPGRPLNQFSLDEEGGYLRIATTVGRGERSSNDVYVLDENLEIVGSLRDIGVTERIYAVRFIGNRGYIVTYREMDPFFVIDLSNPRNPELKGELKIPGYSSYLHPIDEGLVLGIGKEGGEVKVSLFDVSSADEPKELDRYILEEAWTEVLSTHHAFLIDKKHKIFFLPTGEGGYIFSYEGAKLELRKVVSALRAKRAVYIEDYLYVIADTKLVVLDERSWERVKEIEFEKDYIYPLPLPPVPKG